MIRLTTTIVVVWLAGVVPSAGQAAVQPGEQAAQSGVETLAEVRIHGNHTTPDNVVLQLAGLTIGQPLDGAVLEAAVQRLRKSGRFDDADIRKRYRSLEPGGDVALVVVVREHPLPDSALPGPPVLRPIRRLFASGMFMPILGYQDGYGVTYGARFSFVDTWGRGTRLSVPLSWGGTKRAALELERTLTRGPFDRIFGGVAVSRRTNPFYDLDEDRNDAWVEASRRISGPLRAAGHGGYGKVTFGSVSENVVTYGVDLSVDTRMDPVFPRNAVFASMGWERLAPSRSAAVNRFEADARAYRGLIGQSVLSLRIQYAGADGAQPSYARNLLGGVGNLRGYRAGSESGDNLLGASAEVRIPMTSPMGIGRAGIGLFTDIGTVWDHGQTLADQRFRVGVGAGVFLLASVFQLNVDVGIRQGGGARVHVTTGLQF